MTVAEKNMQMSNWIYRNSYLIHKYKGQWIAYNLKGIVAHGTKLHQVTAKADNITKKYVLYFVSPHFEDVRILPIKFKSVKAHEWRPEYVVLLQVENKRKKVKMLVDSGADFCLVPFRIGNELGLELAKVEPVHMAHGISGSIPYVLRNIQITIDKYTFIAPVAWSQDKNCEDIILGREVVFDLFNIEFRQAEEKIIFKKRK